LGDSFLIMNILLIGSGGREHALAWKLRQSPQCKKLFVAPGNAGTGALATNLPVQVNDFDGLAQACRENEIALVVVGPEAPLVNGLRDFLEAQPGLNNLPVVGPGKAGARLEGSKDFSKAFMLRHNIPTAPARTFVLARMEEAIAYLERQQPPVVLKADGLAAGKGVLICPSVPQAKHALREILEQGKFGTAGNKVLVEQFLEGIELSVFVLTDGTDYVLLPEAKDYKRVGDNDTGPNTGGMGAVSPVPFANAHFMEKVEDRIVRPTLEGLRKEHIPYRGFIFIGLMNVAGEPYVIEYNARLGDPETQSVVTRIDSDLAELLLAAATGRLSDKTIRISPEYAVTVVMAAAGYPGDYSRGAAIEGLDCDDDALIFHAGTRKNNQETLTDGGRVLAVTARGKTINDARQKVYRAVQNVQWPGAHHRKDIGLDLLNFER
jgi:phosphoribosylamine--glycine ligase